MPFTFFAWAAANEPGFVDPINPRTGKRSQADSLSVFPSRKARGQFIAQARGTALAVTAKKARQLKAGLDDRAFHELVDLLAGGDL
ncbi:hypothetical protein FE240_08820 [Aeromonas simiae]|uniref:Uncharacterized protein n=2 Tax=Aeromonas simiae TaxID=218936 RepID=A0A5J6X1Z1_9GAMM|nr:hypothetical protein FE240_08820 [Aeromonas simiae]